MLSQLYSSSLRNAGAAEEWSRAVLVAEGQLAPAAATYPLKEGSASGTEDDGRITWTTQSSRTLPPTSVPDLLNASAQLPLLLLRVSVNVSFPGAPGSDRTVAMSTVKLVRKDLMSAVDVVPRACRHSRESRNPGIDILLIVGPLSRGRHRPRAGAGRRGFTLIELLIALTLMALMSAVLFGSLKLAGKSWDSR